MLCEPTHICSQSSSRTTAVRNRQLLDEGHYCSTRITQKKMSRSLTSSENLLHEIPNTKYVSIGTAWCAASENFGEKLECLFKCLARPRPKRVSRREREIESEMRQGGLHEFALLRFLSSCVRELTCAAKAGQLWTTMVLRVRRKRTTPAWRRLLCRRKVVSVKERKEFSHEDPNQTKNKNEIKFSRFFQTANLWAVVLVCFGPNSENE